MTNSTTSSSFPQSIKDKYLIPEFQDIDPEIYNQTFSDDPGWTDRRCPNAEFYIRYSDLGGNTLVYANPDKSPFRMDSKAEARPFIRYRLKIPLGKRKYSQPVKSPQFPFLTGLSDFKNINMTLPIILTEGEKKAYALCSRGIPAIGLTGINGFYTSDAGGYKIAQGYHEIPGIIELLKNHQPGLVLLHDSDALDGNTQRKNSFFGSIKAFKFLFTGIPLRYAMVMPSLGCKGIDDAFLSQPGTEFKDLVLSYPLDCAEDLEKVRNCFFPSTGVKNWDILNTVLTNSGLSFRWNIRKGHLECSRNGEPWHTIGNLDADICREMQLSGVNIGIKKLNEMLLSSEIAEPYDCIASFFIGLPEWDGCDHIEQLCQSVLLPQEEDPMYFKSMLTKHLIRVVRCALERGYVNRIVLVFHGGQGIGKTEFWRWLTPTELYYEETINPASKDSMFPLAGYLIMNMDDLDQLNKKEVAHLKSYISKSGVKQRPVYRPNIEEYARIASFVGSTNRIDILSDEVNTRWLILKVVAFDWQRYTATIDPLNIWSQAYEAYKNDNKAGNLTDAEIGIQASRNTEFLENSIERELILKYFEPGDTAYTMTDVMNFIHDNSFYKCNPHMLGRELKRLFGPPNYTREKGVKGRYYYLKHRPMEQMEPKTFWVRSIANNSN